MLRNFFVFLLIIVMAFSIVACQDKKIIEEELPNYQGNQYDVIVVGGDPEGVAAAIGAGRNDLNVLLVEEGSALGGLMTLGMLNFIDMNYGDDKTLLTQGVFKDFYDRVGGNAFEIDKAKKVFQEMIAEIPTINCKLNTKMKNPILEGNKIIGVKVKENGVERDYYAQVIIDATQDADLAYLAGVPYTFAGEDIGEKDRIMGVTQVFEMKNVNWFKVFSYLNYNRLVGYVKKDERKYMGANTKAAWGYTQEGYNYEPRDPLMRLRGFNIAKQKNGHVLINALLIFDVDVLDSKSREKAKERVEEELKYLVPYIRENFTGFEKAELVGTAEELYVRESRHIVGEYVLTIDDVLECRDQWDKIAVGSYPVDIQPTVQEPWGNVIGHPDRYSIPFRCTVPLKIDNLLVVGRSASYSSLAAGSARVIPIGMCVGEGAGEAAHYSIANNISLREMTRKPEAIKAVQEKLIQEGAYLENFEVEVPPVMEHWAYEGVKTLRGIGLLAGGYENDYQLEGEVDKWYFNYLLTNSLKKIDYPGIDIDDLSQYPTNEEIQSKVAAVISKENISNIDEAKKILKKAGILTSSLEEYFTDSKAKPKRAEVIVLVARTYQFLKENI